MPEEIRGLQASNTLHPQVEIHGFIHLQERINMLEAKRARKGKKVKVEEANVKFTPGEIIDLT